MHKVGLALRNSYHVLECQEVRALGIGLLAFLCTTQVRLYLCRAQVADTASTVTVNYHVSASQNKLLHIQVFVYFQL